MRRAFNLAFDFEWANKNLFYDQYARVGSYFDNSELKATGLPQGRELEILNEVKGEVPPEVFTDEWKNPVNATPEDARKHLAQAAKLLAEAGWQPKGGVLTNAEGVQLTAEFLLVQPDFERIVLPYKSALEKLGVKASVRIVDTSQYQRRARHLRLRHHRRELPAVAVARQRAARFLGLGGRRQGRQPQRHRHQEPGHRQADRQDHPRQGSRRAGGRDACARPRAAVEPLPRAAMAHRPSTAWRCGTCSAGPDKLPSRNTLVPAGVVVR